MDTDLSRLSARVDSLERRVADLEAADWDDDSGCDLGELDECEWRLDAVEELLRVVRLRPELLTVEALAAALDGDMTAALRPMRQGVRDANQPN